LLQLFDGKRSLDDVKERFEHRFPHLQLTADDLLQFIASLHRKNLVLSEVPQQGQALKRRRDEQRRAKALGRLTNLLSIRFPGVDPGRLFDWLYPKVRLAFSPAAVAAALVLVACAALLVAVQFDVFLARLPRFHQFFGLAGALWLMIALVISKVLHELGHGLACKHFGSQCRQIGVMLLVFTPCLYCDVSDSWMLRSKWQRVAIAAAGMYVEVVLAALCTLVWWFSEPGLLNHLCLYLMFVCSVSTVLLNVNPLMRFDGYYILADLWEIPNLRQKSATALRRAIGSWCLGVEASDEPDMPRRQRTLFTLYAVAAALYGWVVIAMILWFLAKVLEPYRLAVLGQLLALAAVIGLVAVPLWKVAKTVRVPGFAARVKPGRIAMSAGVLVLLLAAALLIPLPHHVAAPLVISPHDALPVYVEIPGKLRVVHVRPGQRVTAGMPLAELENLDLEEEIAQLTQERNGRRDRLKTLTRQRFTDAAALAQVPAAREALRAAEHQLALRQADRDKLILRAPRDGAILPALEVPLKSTDGTAPRTWAAHAVVAR
jgi:putative peptide zinc metalloprotease protein